MTVQEFINELLRVARPEDEIYVEKNDSWARSELAPEITIRATTRSFGTMHRVFLS